MRQDKIRADVAAVLLFLGCTWLLPLGADAKSLYVNGVTGNDAISYADNNASNPWRTIGRAAWGSTNRSVPNAREAAQAGDTVLVAPGTYATVGTNVRYDPVYNPVNSGTPSSPITFQGIGTVILTLSSSRGPVIGANDRNYITWKGFTINEAAAPTHADTGPVVLWYTTGSRIENSYIDGNGDPGYGDNHPGVRIEESRNVTVRNNRIRNFYTSVVNQVNGAGVQVYASKGLIIENNEISNVGSGIFFKAIGFTGESLDPSRFSDMEDVVRFNVIYNCAHGVVQHRHQHTVSTVYLLVYQNIIRGCDSGLTLWGYQGDGPTNGRFVNNTIDGCGDSITMKAGEISPGSNNLYQNNLITNSSSHAIFNDGASQSFDLGRLVYDFNWYWNYPIFLQDMASPRTFAQFRSTYSGDENNGINGGDPGYVDRAAGNFHLSGGSPALTAGRVVHGIGGANGDTIPVGAYIRGAEVIGLVPSNLSPPRIPSNLQIVPPQ